MTHTFHAGDGALTGARERLNAEHPMVGGDDARD
jgi:hypothetical protein